MLLLYYVVSVLQKLIQSEATVLNREEMGITNLSAEYIPPSTIICSFKNNNITKIPSNFFVGLPVLDKIYLNKNYIIEISDYAFSGVPSVINLKLGGNNLIIIRKHMLRGLFNLRTLILISNQISMIEERSFIDLRSLRKLNVANNELLTISLSIFHPITHPSSVEFFRLDGNPLLCDSCLCWLLQSSWIAPRTSYPTECAGPMQLTGRPWDSLTADDLNCFDITCEMGSTGISLGESVID